MDLSRAVAELPPQARTVFLLHDLEGFKHREVAERLGISEGTSKSQLFRAREMLRQHLGSSLEVPA
jgi:RNA polymerase sigma-70 factor (ECF subfamily)